MLETSPWPQARARISGAKIISGDEPQTTDEQIQKICALMDKTDTARNFERDQKQPPQSYLLPTLPPTGMRFQQQNRWHRPMVRRIVKPVLKYD